MIRYCFLLHKWYMQRGRSIQAHENCFEFNPWNDAFTMNVVKLMIIRKERRIESRA